MSPENLPVLPGSSVEVVQTTEPAPAPANPLVVIHSLLRGRYLLAICLAVLLGAIGAPVGYLAQKPQYQSVGIIRVQPILPKILYQTEQNGVMPMFDSFLASQVAQAQSRRVTGEAMLQPEWKAFGRGLTPEAVAKFEANLTVENPRGTPLIQVSFTDSDPKAAAAAVKSVIETYLRLYADTETESGTPMMTVLDNLRIELTAKLNGINDQILGIANDFGSASLQEVYEFKLGQLNRVESQLQQAKIQALLSSPEASATTQPAIQRQELSTETLADRDPILRGLLQQKMDADRQARIMETRYGENFPQAAGARVLVKQIQSDIDERVDQLKADGIADTPTLSLNGDSRQVTPEQLKENVDALDKLYQSLKKETVDLGRKNLQIQKLQADAADVRDRLEDTKNRIQQLTVEKNVSGRISVISYGDIPLTPEKDRRIALSVVGGLGGAGLGIGVVMLIGLLDRRMHHVDSARSRLKRIDRLLGVLPHLPDNLTDAEQASSTAHCVHHIRAMLQIRQRVTGHKTFAITSPSPGDGKTSLTISLGMSLAASGCNTLVVDCDMDGGALTAKVGRVARKLLGQIMLDYGAVGESRLEEALHLSREKKIRLGEALVKLGDVSRAQVDEALVEQKAAAPGLGDVLGGAPVEHAILGTGYPLLSVLPLGRPPGAHAGRLSPDAIRRVLDSLSSKFDTVLVDCGPILGSVEAAIVSAEVDGVVLVVSRGGDRNAAENAVSLLVSAGAEIEGIVFNRAEASDVAASIFSSSGSIKSDSTAARMKSQSVPSQGAVNSDAPTDQEGETTS